eukprot:c36347_g1_i1 orf=102-383(+)
MYECNKQAEDPLQTGEQERSYHLLKIVDANVPPWRQTKSPDALRDERDAQFNVCRRRSEPLMPQTRGTKVRNVCNAQGVSVTDTNQNVVAEGL